MLSIVWLCTELCTQFGRGRHSAFFIALKLKPIIAEKAKAKQAEAGGAVRQKSDKAVIDTQKELAKIAGVSHDTVRKAFSKSERVDYMYRLMRIEQEKARDRMENGKSIDPGQKSDGGTGRADEKTAESFGISRDTMRKEMQIVDNKHLLDPSDFADWDEGKLSTNKADQTKAEQRIGEILLSIPKQAGAVNSSRDVEKLKTKSEVVSDMGYSKDQVSDYQRMAQNHERHGKYSN